MPTNLHSPHTSEQKNEEYGQSAVPTDYYQTPHTDKGKGKDKGR